MINLVPKARFLVLMILAFMTSPGLAVATYRIKQVETSTLRYTDRQWLLSYLKLDKCPCELEDKDFAFITQRLLTTQVFLRADPQLVKLEQDEYLLHLELDEKWTMIPVIRGAFGGGTPLLVAGIYDTHVFGRLWTLGAETRTYGSAPTGGVVWARAPRWLDGHHYFNLELWQDNRIRNLFDGQERQRKQLFMRNSLLRAEILRPIFTDEQNPWQIGLRIQLKSPGDYKERQFYPGPLSERFDKELRKEMQSTLRLVYDDLVVTGQNLDGQRHLISAGPGLSSQRPKWTLEQELFWYELFPQDWNLCIHEWLGISDDQSYQSLLFLGGFESVRGLPDGIMFGNRAYYANVEIRKIIGRSEYTSWQAAGFFDLGAADFDNSGLKKPRQSLGFGVRVAIPQVNRLAFRFDYARSLDRPQTSSLSLGMNQFIDPYRPL